MQCFPLTRPCTAAVHVVDFYLDDAREKERSHIFQLVRKKDPAADQLLQGYVREAMRE
jgi:linoleate 10R-lipoxygenase